MQNNDSLPDETTTGSSYLKKHYLFDIYTKGGKRLYLRSDDTIQISADNRYSQHFSLNMLEHFADDNGNNIALIHGIKEPQYLSANILNGSTIKVHRYIDGQNHGSFTAIVSNIKIYDTDFFLYLESEIKKLDKSATISISQKCRASFGSKECGVNLEALKKEFLVSNYSNDEIWFENSINRPDNYYASGVCYIENQEFAILKQFDNSIILKDNVDLNTLRPFTQVILRPGCDKNFTTCSHKFSNSINFRGEPFLPNEKHLQV